MNKRKLLTIWKQIKSAGMVLIPNTDRIQQVEDYVSGCT